MNKQLFTLAASLAFVLLLIFALSIFPRNNDKQADSKGGKNAENQKEPMDFTDSTLFEIKTKIDLPDTPEPSLFPLFETATPGERHKYAIKLTAEKAGEPKREWQGSATIRFESKASKTTIKRKRMDQGSRPARDYNLVERQLATGLAIPRRSVLVSHQLVEGVNSAKVIYKGRQYEAKVKTRLPKTGFAILKLEGVEFAKVTIPNSNVKFDKEINVAWLDSTGNLESRTVKHNSYSSHLGGQYAVKSQLPDNCSGGVAFDKEGKVIGVVVDTIHPDFDNNGYSRIHPISRIAETWSEYGRNVIFTNSFGHLAKDPMERVKNRLVQVIVQREAKPQSDLIYFVDLNLEAPNAASGRKINFHTPRVRMKSSELINYDPNSNAVSRLNPSTQLPFYLGSVFENIILPLRHQDGETTNSQAVSLSPNGFIKTQNETTINGMTINKIKIEKTDYPFIYGTRTFEVNNKGRRNDEGSLPGLIKLEIEQSFVINGDKSMLHESSANGTFVIEANGKSVEYQLSLDINRAE